MAQELIDSLAQAALDGRLGLLIGTGFSKALTDGQKTRAPSWRELLEQVASNAGIEITHEVGQSFPQIASTLANAWSARYPALNHQDNLTADACSPGVMWLKLSVASRCAYLVPGPRRQRYRDVLRALKPAWVVTTNYDLCIEEVLPEATLVPPNGAFFPSRRHVPVFHLHGHRLDPASIVITEEDHVRAARLAATNAVRPSALLSECTTLVLGYGLRDPNVLAAMHWSRGARDVRSRAVVQAVFNPLPSGRSYKGGFGQDVLEVSDIGQLLETIAHRMRELSTRREIRLVEARNWLLAASATDASGRPQLAALSSADRRAVFLALQDLSQTEGNTDVLNLLSQSFVHLWTQAREHHHYAHYRDLLEMIVDGFSVWHTPEQDAGLFSFLSSWLCQVAPYVGRGLGQSFAAYALWEEKKHELPSLVRTEVLAVAQAHSMACAVKMLSA